MMLQHSLRVGTAKQHCDLTRMCIACPRGADNPTWFIITKKTEEVYEEWIMRLGTRFAHKVAQTLAQKMKPNLQTCAYKYREEQSVEMVFRMTQLWVWARKELQKMYSPAQLAIRTAEWRRGALDQDLLGHCKLMDKDFKLKDLRFVSLDLELCSSAAVVMADGQGQ